MIKMSIKEREKILLLLVQALVANKRTPQRALPRYLRARYQTSKCSDRAMWRAGNSSRGLSCLRPCAAGIGSSTLSGTLHGSRTTTTTKALKKAHGSSKMSLLQVVLLALLNLHCVSEMTSSHLCLQSIPHPHREVHTRHCQPLLGLQIASARYRMAALSYTPTPPPFSASQLMYVASLL